LIVMCTVRPRSILPFTSKILFGTHFRPKSGDASTGDKLATARASAAAEQHRRIHPPPGAMDFPLDPIERSVDLGSHIISEPLASVLLLPVYDFSSGGCARIC
jgi:hypothetical protein